MVNFAIISIASSRENDFKFWAHSSYVSDLQDKYISKSWVIWKLKGFSCITGNVLRLCEGADFNLRLPSEDDTSNLIKIFERRR